MAVRIILLYKRCVGFGGRYTQQQQQNACFNCFSFIKHTRKLITTVASNLVDKLPPSFNLFHTESPTFHNFYKSKNVQDDEFMLISVNEDFIYKELCKLNPSKSTGTDKVPARFVMMQLQISKNLLGCRLV